MSLIEWWQNLPAEISPVFFNLGPIPIRWYGLMYLVAFVIAYYMARYRVKKGEAEVVDKDKVKAQKIIDDYFMWGIIGLLIGARVGYALFYNFSEFISNPLSLIWPFQNGEFIGLSGMSFHGGVIGVTVAFAIYSYKRKTSLISIGDIIVPGIPLGYTFGRIGNWLNGELWGRVTESPIGQYFPQAGDGLLHHPSQLYEAILEGLVLFIILWLLRHKAAKWGNGVIGGLFLAGYAIARIIVEFFRQPDAHIGFLAGGLTMGQILSLIMLATGIWLTWWRWGKE